MRTLYIECNMGAAGDMLMAALSELIPEPDRFVEKMNAIALSSVMDRSYLALWMISLAFTTL